MYRHVLCVYPYRRELNDVGFFPPLGLEFIAAVLAPHAQSLDIMDLRQEPGHARDFLRPETDLVCFSVNWDREGDFVRDEIRSIPESIFTLLGGRHATEDPERWLSDCPNVDALVRGDGEEAVEELCRGTAFEHIAGLSFRRGDRIVHTDNREPGPVNDALRPDRRLRRSDYQIAIKGAPTGIRVDTVAGSRGCPFNCTFCSFSRNPWGVKRQWSARSPESVVAELEQIAAPIVGFTDDLFTFDLDRVERICDLLLERGIRKKYLANARLELARRPDVIRKMERAGFALLMLGVESTQDRTLKSMRKGFDTARIREYFAVLRQSTMLLHGYFILGNIGESRAEMRTIPAFAHEIGVDTLAISTLRATPYAGLEELVAKNPGYHIARNGKVYSDDYSVADLRRLRREIYREFYSHRHLVALARKAIRNGALGFLPRLLYHAPGIAWHVLRAERRRHGHRAPVPAEGL